MLLSHPFHRWGARPQEHAQLPRGDQELQEPGVQADCSVTHALSTSVSRVWPPGFQAVPEGLAGTLTARAGTALRPGMGN